MALNTHTGYLPGVGVVRVHVRGELIEDSELLLADDTWREDLALDGVLLPGLVDLQVNGFDGVDLSSPDVTPDDVLTMVRSLWHQGVTSFCPTLITAPLERLGSTLSLLDSVRCRPGPEARSLLGAHLEGPWISALDGARGAHPIEHVRTADRSQAERLLDSGRVDLLTVAAEVDGVLDVVELATARGVTVSLGHSAASPEEVIAAVDRGASMSTHLGNGVPAMLPRHPNLVWEQLSDNRLTAMFIADLHHLDATTLTAMVRAKGEDRAVLVSDATSLAGMPAGSYQTWIGGEVELGRDGRLAVAGTQYLAGAALPLIDGLSNVLARRLMTPRGAVESATIIPRRHVRVAHSDSHSLLPRGDRADLVLASWNSEDQRLMVRQTVVAGSTVWAA